jgi:hypothetical protein
VREEGGKKRKWKTEDVRRENKKNEPITINQYKRKE